MKAARKRLSLLLFLFVSFAGLFFFCRPVKAAYKRILAEGSRSEKERTAFGITYLSEYRAGSDYTLYSVSGSEKSVLIDSFAGGAFLTNGKTLFFLSSKSFSGGTVSSLDLTGGEETLIGSVSGLDNALELEGFYKGKLYLASTPDGALYSMTQAGRVKKLTGDETKVTSVEQYGKYFLLADGTGAGISHLSAYDAGKGRVKKLADKPISWVVKNKTVYCLCYISSDSYLYMPPCNARIHRISLAGKNKKFLCKTFYMQSLKKLTAGKCIYVAKNKKTKKIRW